MVELPHILIVMIQEVGIEHRVKQGLSLFLVEATYYVGPYKSYALGSHQFVEAGYNEIGVRRERIFLKVIQVGQDLHKIRINRGLQRIFADSARAS
jgi:hypothetical protein